MLWKMNPKSLMMPLKVHRLINKTQLESERKEGEGSGAGGVGFLVVSGRVVESSHRRMGQQPRRLRDVAEVRCRFPTPKRRWKTDCTINSYVEETLQIERERARVNAMSDPQTFQFSAPGSTILPPPPARSFAVSSLLGLI